MSDTVSSAVLLSYLAPEGPSFIPADASSVSGALHVSGGAHADQNVSLVIDFRPLLPQGAETSTEVTRTGPTLSAYVGLVTDDGPAVMVGGALHSIDVCGG